MKLSDAQIEHMTSAFLRWKLPPDFSPDGGISFQKEYNTHTPHPMKFEPVGTNLFTHTQAKAMIENLLEGMPEE